MALPLLSLTLFLVSIAGLWTIANFLTKDNRLPFVTCIWWVLIARIIGFFAAMFVIQFELILPGIVFGEAVVASILFYFVNNHYGNILALKIVGIYVALTEFAAILLFYL